MHGAAALPSPAGCAMMRPLRSRTMTKLATAFHVLLVLLLTGLGAAACGSRTDIGNYGGGGGGPPGGGCMSDADCAQPTPHCRLDTHMCVQCTESSQCPSGEQCDNFQCVA